MSGPKKLSLKVVTNKEKTKVLFAEANSDFVNVLLSFLLLPLGTIVKVWKKHCGEKSSAIGSLSTLYNGVENLDSIHFPTEDAKTSLLNPKGLDDDDDDDDDDDEDEWPDFRGDFTETTTSYIISDDLRVMPIVVSSVISTLTDLGIVITDLDGAQTYDKDFVYDHEIPRLLWVTLISWNPLTTFLLRGSWIRMRRTAGKEDAMNQIGKKDISMNSKKMILKAMMQKSTNKLLFAQAHDDFVSFLFGLLTIPLGRVEWYFHSNTGSSNMDNLHRSIPDSLYNNQLMTPETKDLLFNPPLSAEDDSSNHYIPLNFDPSMNQNHVRGGSRVYMVKDDLTVAPLTITSSISVIEAMKISLSDVEEMELQVGLVEGLSILRAALTSATALTDGLIKPTMKKQPKQENRVNRSCPRILIYHSVAYIRSRMHVEKRHSNSSLHAVFALSASSTSGFFHFCPSTLNSDAK